MQLAQFLSLIGFVAGNANAMTIKGVVLGKHTSHQISAETFGSASCPGEAGFKRDEAISRISAKYHYLSCTVPISFFGRSTKADVTFANAWIVKDISIDILTAQGDQVEKAMIDHYGKPDAMRGPENPQMLMPCSVWHRVEDASVSICGWGSWDHFTVTYSYIGPLAE